MVVNVDEQGINANRQPFSNISNPFDVNLVDTHGTFSLFVIECRGYLIPRATLAFPFFRKAL